MMPSTYRPHTRHSPLTQPWEPLFSQVVSGVIQLAVEIREPHCNSRGFAHGGMITSLADNAMGLSATRQSREITGSTTSSAVTVSLSVDFIDVARIGDILEIIPCVLKVGRTLAFVDCRIMTADRLIARGNATFRLV
ncbi:MAG: PaaI family thioesterase [Burkholderiaceae bacterium]